MNNQEAPLISIVMPCYNSANSLPRALASLIAQSYENWECILVDDGSKDAPEKIVNRFADQRIKLHKLDRNYGRGVARQRGLENCAGEYLCMLDADDWYYPTKLQQQLKIMTDNKDIGILSTDMAVTDSAGGLQGVQRFGNSVDALSIYDPMSIPNVLKIAHGPCMIRMEIAKQGKYNPDYRLAQDFDFLLPILLRHKYANLNSATYVYSVFESISLYKLLQRLLRSRQIISKYRNSYSTLKILRNEFICLSKMPAYIGLYSLGLGRWAIKRRTAEATGPERNIYISALNGINQYLETLGW